MPSQPFRRVELITGSVLHCDVEFPPPGGRIICGATAVVRAVYPFDKSASFFCLEHWNEIKHAGDPTLDELRSSAALVTAVSKLSK